MGGVKSTRNIEIFRENVIKTVCLNYILIKKNIKMENIRSRKLCYEAPEMKTSEFRTEQGYAVSPTDPANLFEVHMLKN